MNVPVTAIDGLVGYYLTGVLLRQSDIWLFDTVPPAESVEPVDARAAMQQWRDSIYTTLEAGVAIVDEVRRIVFETEPEKVFPHPGQAFVPASIESPQETFRTNMFGVLPIFEEDDRIRRSP